MNQETRYKIIFIPASDFIQFKSSLSKGQMKTCSALDAKNIDNFMVGDGASAAYVIEEHREFLNTKARSGEAL